MSPRKSSTSSGRRTTRRPRYLGLVVAPDGGPGTPSPSIWESRLQAQLLGAGFDRVRFRVVRSTPRKAVVEVDHLDVEAARAAWNTPPLEGAPPALATVRSWGTLRGAKAWLASRGPPEGTATR